MKKHEQGFELFKERCGDVTNEEIATAVGASVATVRKWKSRYEWLEKLAAEDCHTGVTKSECDKIELDARGLENKRVVDAMNEAGTYSPAFDLLIELYLDAYMEYVEARENGAAEERQRKELARLLKQLGLDITNKVLVKNSGVVIKGAEQEKQAPPPDEPPKQVSRLDDFRNRRKRGS